MSQKTVTYKAFSEILCPQYPFARLLVLFMSLAVFTVLLCALNFVFREFYIDRFISQTALAATAHKDEYIDIYTVGLRFDAKLAYLMMLPAVAISFFALVHEVFYRPIVKIIAAWVGVCAFMMMTLTLANMNCLGAYGYPLTLDQVQAFFADPSSALAKFPIFFDVIMTLFVTILFVGLWQRLTMIFSTSSLWHTEGWINWLIVLCCFCGLMWTSAQTSITSTTPLTVSAAKISKEPMINYLVMNAPISVLWSDKLGVLGQPQTPSQDTNP